MNGGSLKAPGLCGSVPELQRDLAARFAALRCLGSGWVLGSSIMRLSSEGLSSDNY